MATETGLSPPDDIPLQSLHPSQVELAQEYTCGSKYPVPRKLFAKRPDVEESRRLDKPFARWDEDQAKNVARRLACEYDMCGSEAVFVRAARVLWAQHARGDVKPDDRDRTNHRGETVSVNETEKLSTEEIDAVTNEEGMSFWEQPWPLKTTYLMLFVAATVQGWTQTATNGANLSWPTALRLDGNTTGNSSNTAFGITTCAATPQRIWAFAAVNAAPYLAAGVLCLFSDVLINELRFGRRGAIIVSAVSVILAAIFGSATQKTWQFALTRVLLGFGMGCKASVVPVFAAEIAPPHLRGTLVMNWQVFDALGIFLGFTANLIASVAGSAAWRWQVGSSAVPAFALFWGTMFVCWDSPRFLMKHEKRYQRQFTKGSFLKSMGKHLFKARGVPVYRSNAYSTLLLLRGEPILAAKELIYAHCQLLVEKGSRKGAQFQDPMSSDDFSLEYGYGLRAWTSRFKRLFTEGFIRRELMAAATVMVCQQLCGVNVLIFYSTTLFCQTGNDTDRSTALRPLLLSWGLGLCNMVFAYPAYNWIESKGRRKLVITTLPVLAILMAIIAAILATQEMRPAGNPTPFFSEGRRDATIFLAYLFVAIYSFGLGPVPFTLSAEVFPLEERMVGMSVAVALNFLGAGCLTLLVPPLTSDPAVLLGPFAALNFAGFIFVWVFVREVANERPVATHQAGADSVDAKQRKRMGPLTLEGVFKVFEPNILEHIEFRWRRLTGWENKMTGSFIEFYETKKQREGNGNAGT